MFKAIKTLFSSDKLVENISSGVDKMVLTAEERLDNFKELLVIYTPFKIAQRILAITFCVPYVLCWVGNFILSYWVSDAKPMADMLNGDMGTIVITIVVFYFGGGALEGVVTRFKGISK
jgi:hypothetical protein